MNFKSNSGIDSKFLTSDSRPLKCPSEYFGVEQMMAVLGSALGENNRGGVLKADKYLLPFLQDLMR